MISWVGDCLIFAKNKSFAYALIHELQQSFTLTEDEDVLAYLGVEVHIDKDNDTVSLTQPFLIK